MFLRGAGVNIGAPEYGGGVPKIRVLFLYTHILGAGIESKPKRSL